MTKTNFIRQFIIGMVFVGLVAGCAGGVHKESTGEYIDDSVLTSKVKAEIFNDPMLKVLQINVETYKGVVQLSGFVNSAEASAKAEKIAFSLKGVKGVENNIIVK
jgi:osmotically-inducible protein OsmY